MPKEDTGVACKAITYPIPNPPVAVNWKHSFTLVKRGVKKQVITLIDAPEQFRE